jgi:uncharacterized protein YcnI
MKKFIQWCVFTVLGLSLAGVVSAHVAVYPKEAAAGSGIASVRVPNEKDIPTTQIRLVVPEGVEVDGVMPLAGWTHTEKKEPVKSGSGTPEMSDDGDAAPTDRVSEVTWTGGKIGAGEYMEFPLSVLYSGAADTVAWKTYQTYADGSVVAWDGSDAKKPAAVVKVLKEADAGASGANGKVSADAGTVSSPWLSVAAVILSVAAVGISLKKK